MNTTNIKLRIECIVTSGNAGTLAPVWRSPNPSPIIDSTFNSHADNWGAVAGPPPVAEADLRDSAAAFLVRCFLSNHTWPKYKRIGCIK